MNKIFILLLMVVAGTACTKNNFIDTGKASGIFDGNVVEYMKSNPYNWDSTLVVIEWAGLTPLFEGKDDRYPEITFFAPTKHSILRYMLDNEIKCIKDVEPEVWKAMLLRHVIPGKYMKDDFAAGDVSEGGDTFTALAGNHIRVYRKLNPYKEMPDVGASTLHIQSVDTEYSIVMIASADIEPDNAAVHSLVYSFTFGKF